MKLRPFLRNIISIVLFCSCQNHISILETYVFRNQSGSDIKAYRTHYNMDSIVFLFEIPKNKSYTLKSDWAEASHLREVGPFAHFPFPFFSLDTSFLSLIKIENSLIQYFLQMIVQYRIIFTVKNLTLLLKSAILNIPMFTPLPKKTITMPLPWHLGRA